MSPELTMRLLASIAISLAACATPPPPPVVEAPPPPPSVAEAPPPPLLRPQLAENIQAIVDASGKRWPFEIVPVPQAKCRKLSGWPADLMECWLEPRAGGSAAQLVMQTRCEADSCEFETWLFADGSGKPQRPTADELSLDHLFAYEEVVVLSPDALMVDRRLVRVVRETRKRSKFAPCFSPTISPAGHWILCRDRRANVVAVAAGGGDARIIITSNLPLEHVLWQPQWYDFPSKIWFEDANSLHYKMDLNSALPRALEKRRAKLEGPFKIEWRE